MKKALTIEELKNRVGKPVFVAGLIYGAKNWRVVKGFGGANTIEFTDKSAIAAEHQNRFRYFDEEVTALELKEILDAEEKEKKKKTGYERVEKGEFYYAISSLKEVMEFSDGGFLESNTEKRFKTASYFNDEKLAKNIARAEQLKYKLRRYAALNGGIPSQKDWKDLKSKKNYISYDCVNNKLSIYDRQILKEFGQIYFKNKEACEKAIEIFKKELIWYFTEFQEQLY